MKRILVLLIMVGLVIAPMGCGTKIVKQACDPSSDMRAQIESYRVQAQALVAYFQTMPLPLPPEARLALAAAQTALSVFNDALAGVCLAAKTLEDAFNSVVSTKTVAKAKYGFKG